MPGSRILAVDDDELVLKVLHMQLTRRGYDVTAVSSVSAAISELSTRPFDVLLADLNIGEPGDGFTVVSAMRRVQPNAITIILTGYPDFDTALNAIRNQVDDYFVKPPNFPKLCETIEERLRGGGSAGYGTAGLTVAAVIDQNAEEITKDWLAVTSKIPALLAAPLPYGTTPPSHTPASACRRALVGGSR